MNFNAAWGLTEAGKVIFHSSGFVLTTTEFLSVDILQAVGAGVDLEDGWELDEKVTV